MKRISLFKINILFLKKPKLAEPKKDQEIEEIIKKSFYEINVYKLSKNRQNFA